MGGSRLGIGGQGWIAMVGRDRARLEADWVRGGSSPVQSLARRRDSRLASELQVAAAAALEDGERVVEEARVVYLGPLTASRAVCAFTDHRFIVARERNLDPVDDHFAQVTAIRGNPVALTVTLTDEPPADFARDSHLEREHRLFFGFQAWVRELFTELASARSPFFSERLRGIARFRTRRLKPLAEWNYCPLCERPFEVRVDHAAYCSECKRLYADAGYEPVISLPTDPMSSVLIARRVTGVDEAAEQANCVRPYGMARQADDVFNGAVVLDRELERDARQS